MLLHRESRITAIAIVVFFLILIGYALYEARALVFGPRIDVAREATIVNDPMATIEGSASHITSLSMNGKEIPVTVAGDFHERYLLAPGLNHIVLDARDSWGNTAQKVVEIYYAPRGNASSMP